MNTEYNAATTLLDRGIKVPVTAPLWLRVFGKRRINLVVRAPYYGTLQRIGLIFLGMNMSMEELDAIDELNSLKLFIDHGKAVTRIVAFALLNNKWAGKVFGGMLSRYLYWKLTPISGFTIVKVLVMLCSIQAFPNTIRLVSGMKMTTPNLSQPTEGS